LSAHNNINWHVLTISVRWRSPQPFACSRFFLSRVSQENPFLQVGDELALSP